MLLQNIAQSIAYNHPDCVLMVLLIAGACAAGWFLYDPISAWLTEKAEEHQQRQEQQRQEEQNQNQPGNPENPGTTDEPTAEQTALPESCAVLDTAVLYDMAALENRLSALAAKGYTGAVFTLKDEDGLVLYQSALEDVTGNTAQTAQRYDLPAVIAKIKAAGLTPVGRLWAFDDHTAGRKLTDATVKYNYTETNWIHNDKEAGGHTWLNPMSERAQGYILSLLGEAADNGLEVLILEGVQFPTGYSLNLATYAEKGVTVDKSKVLADFTAKAAAAMKARNVSLWTAGGSFRRERAAGRQPADCDGLGGELPDQGGAGAVCHPQGPAGGEHLYRDASVVVLPFQKAAGRGNAGRGGAGLCPRGGPVAGQRLGRDPAGGADPGGAGSRRGEHPAGADKIIKQGRFAPGGAGRPFCGDWRQGRAGPQARRRAAPPQQSQTAETARRAVWPAAPAGPLHKPAQTAKKKSPAFAEPFPTKIIFIRQSFWETGKLFKGRWWRHRAPFLCLYYMPPRGRIPPF